MQVHQYASPEATSCSAYARYVVIRSDWMYGSWGPPISGTLVPVQPEPAERLEDQRLGVGDVALLVGVLDTEDEVAARVPCRQKGEERGAYRTEMQRSGR